MKKPVKRGALVLMLGLVGVLAWVFLVLPTRVDRQMNGVRVKRVKVSKEAQQRHQQLAFVADLHADSLLWKRALTRRHGHGHVDLPRLQEANVALQVFSIVTKSPKGQSVDGTDAKSMDRITLLAVVQRWPWRSWFSLAQRALYQMERLRRVAALPGSSLRLVRTREDLHALRAARRRNKKLVGGLLAIEGAHALAGDLRNVDRFFARGLRMMAATHFFDNALGGSAHGRKRGGLTAFGKQVLKRMEALGMVVDLAHVSAKAIDDTLRLATRPVVVSHTGVRGTCNNNRNLSDAQLDAIAKNGGVVGIGLWDKAVCGKDIQATVRAMRYVAKRIGVRHVALGSDFDGTVLAPFDVTGLPALTEALGKAGFSSKEIQMIMGENVYRLLERVLPAGTDAASRTPKTRGVPARLDANKAPQSSSRKALQPPPRKALQPSPRKAPMRPRKPE